MVDKSMRHQLFNNELVYSSVQLLHHFFMLPPIIDSVKQEFCSVVAPKSKKVISF